MFTLADFEIFLDRFQADAEWNGRRLEIRRRLQGLGEKAQKELRKLDVDVDRRESLHHPHASNGKRVRRQRTMLFRGKRARKALQGFLGKELGKDLDSAVNNLHFQAGLDARCAYWGLRLDTGAWYDLNSLVKRAEEEEGRSEILAACRAAPGFDLEVDGGGARPLDRMDSRDWRDLAGVLQPGTSRLEVVKRRPAADASAAADLGAEIVADLVKLAGFYRLACWTLDGSSPSGVSW